MRARLHAHLRGALSVGLVGGFALGIREALLGMATNAMIQPGDYFLVYLAVPIVAWLALAVLIVLPLALALGLWRGAPEARSTLWVHAAVLALAGTWSIGEPLIRVTAERLTAVGLAPGMPIRSTLHALAVILAAAAAAIVGATARRYAPVLDRSLGYAALAVTATVPPLLWPVARFFASDWKWNAPPASASALPSDGHNVLLISIDTLRADHLGSAGNPERLTPHLDRLAGDGVVFTQTITSSPWTLPAIASLLTALYPRHHGAGTIINGRTPLGRSPLPSGMWTLPRALHEQGYRTHAIVTNPYLALHYGFGEGFDSYENVTIESEAFVSFAQTTAVRLLTWLWPDIIVGDRGATVSNRARQWLDRVDPARPFFLWLHYIDPHPPYSRMGATRHKSMRGDLSSGGSGETSHAVLLRSPDVARLRSGEIRLNAPEKEAVHDLYRAEVRSVDGAVGDVLNALDRKGLADRTLVVVVGDHGEEFWEHGGVEHGHSVYEEVIRVPLLMRWRGHLPAGARVDALARITDVAPTILDLLGMSPPGNRDGTSLLPFLRAESPEPRVALIENMLFAEERSGVRTEDYKYVRWQNGKEELYDLRADARESRDVAALDGALDELRRLDTEVGRGGSPTARDSTAPQLDAGTVEALRALGYVN